MPPPRRRWPAPWHSTASAPRYRRERFHDAVDVVTEAVSHQRPDCEVSACLRPRWTPRSQHLLESPPPLLVLGRPRSRAGRPPRPRAGRAAPPRCSTTCSSTPCQARGHQRRGGRTPVPPALDRAEVERAFRRPHRADRRHRAYAHWAYFRRVVSRTRVSRSGRGSGSSVGAMVPEGGLTGAIDADRWPAPVAAPACSRTVLPAAAPGARPRAAPDLHPLVRHLKGVIVLGLADPPWGGVRGSGPAEAEQIVVETVEAFHQQREVAYRSRDGPRRQVADTATRRSTGRGRDVDGHRGAS